MSNLAYTRPLGVWNTGVIYAVELADLDAKTVKAPNFDGGGTYAPSDVITVGGAGMTLTMVGINTAEGMFVTGTFDSAFGSNAWFRGNTGFRAGSTTSVRDGATWIFNSGSSTTFDVGSFLSIYDATCNSLTAGGLSTSTIQVATSLYMAPDSAASLNGSLSVAQATYLHGEAHFEGTTFVEGTLALTGAGAIQERCAVGANANTTYSVSTVDVVWVNPNDMTASWVYSVDTIGAAEGKKMRFAFFSTSHSYTIEIRIAGSHQLAVLGPGTFPGYFRWVDIQFIDGQWRLVAGGNPS
jgi:hypothetical protein